MTSASTRPSGLGAVDRQWGGFADGRAYLLVGRAGAGRSALALQTARATNDAGQRCLVISPRPPEALVEVGRDVGLDLAAAHGAGKLRLLRIPSAAELAARGPEGLAKSYRALAGLVASDHPARVVVEDFTPLVQFDTFDHFHEAFAGLVEAIRPLGTTLVVGLGDPANDASRRLLDVVEGLVDGTIHLGANGALVLALPGHPEYPSSDGASVEATPPPPAAPALPRAPASDFFSSSAPDPAAPTYTPPTPSYDAPEPSFGFPSSDQSPPASPHESPEPAVAGPDAPAYAAPKPMTAPTYAPPGATSGVPQDPYGALAPPQEPAFMPPPPGAEGFSVDFSLPDPLADDDPFAQTPTPAPARAADASTPGVPPTTEVVPPPTPDPSLFAPTEDRFALDPADALFEQGYLADSRAGLGLPLAPSTDPGAPSFAPLSAPTPDARSAFRSALDQTFASRSAGVPFVFVAVRMNPDAPEAAQFAALEAGLRSALRPNDAILVDAPRLRAAVVLPQSGPEAGQALFAGLQQHLRSMLGTAAEPILQGVGAVTIPNGQPFRTAEELMTYAFEG